MTLERAAAIAAGPHALRAGCTDSELVQAAALLAGAAYRMSLCVQFREEGVAGHEHTPTAQQETARP